MQRVMVGAFALFGLLCLTHAPARGDGDPYNSGHDDYVVIGTIQSVSRSDDRLTLAGSDDHRYIVDAYGADILLRESRRLGETTDLARGMRVEVTGTLLGHNLLEASRLRVLREFGGAPAPAPAVFEEPAPLPAPAPYNPPAPATYNPPIIAVPAQPQLTVDGLIRDVDPAHDQVTLLGDDDRRYTADTRHTDIILREIARAGQTSDLSRGMRVRLIGAPLPDGLVEADRIRVLSPGDAAAPPLPAPAAPPAEEDFSLYTGILLDARDLPRISRSPAPAVYGPGPNLDLLYPDRSHVPTPDEVQEESVVRYYWTVGDAENGVAGNHPLILTAQAVIGPAEDAVQLSPEDAVRFATLDKRLHFTRTWKVGFLVPADH